MTFLHTSTPNIKFDFLFTSQQTWLDWCKQFAGYLFDPKSLPHVREYPTRKLQTQSKPRCSSVLCERCEILQTHVCPGFVWWHARSIHKRKATSELTSNSEDMHNHLIAVRKAYSYVSGNIELQSGINVIRDEPKGSLRSHTQNVKLITSFCSWFRIQNPKRSRWRELERDSSLGLKLRTHPL